VDAIVAGETLPFYVRDVIVGRLYALGVEIIPYAHLFGADENSVYFHHSASGEPMIFEGVDTLVLSQGNERVNQLEENFPSIACQIYTIGDAFSPRTAEEAVLDGLKIGVEL
jgi:hypothetical protein